MADNSITAYDGDEPFIFVSYSHSDSSLVFPELIRLKSLGFNIWYDEGIKVGQNWTDELARRLNQCALVIYLVTPGSVLSRHCANEIHYAMDINKPMLVVHLRPAVLPPGQRMQLGLIQGIIKHELSETEYSTKLADAVSELMGASANRTKEEIEPDRAALPMGIVTMLRLDIVGNHEFALKHGDGLTDIYLRLHHLTREIIKTHDGYEVEMKGDICFAAFITAGEALLAAIDIQRACQREKWPLNEVVRIRLGLHTGQPVLVDNHYFGVDVQRAVSIASIAVGGQILMSAATRDHLTEQGLPEGATLRDLGSHRLKDIPFPEVLYDILTSGSEEIVEPIGSLTNRPSNLPKTLSKFIGRKRELVEITDVIRREDTQILTLTGPGGTGKTRLSIETGRLLERDFPDGVFMIHLASVTDSNRVIPTIAETLGIREIAGQSPLQQLLNRFSNSHILLIMDNFEQIIEGAAGLLELLQSCQNLKILVSSREPLNLRMEREYQVQPLQLPKPDDVQHIDRLCEVESISLFIERVRESQWDFKVDRSNAEAIAGICIKLDGLPLALELAAARLKILSPKALLDNLDRSLDVLKSKSRDIPDRQRTLNSTVEWSYNLLDEEERNLFRHLSVFTDGFSIVSAQIALADYHDPLDLIECIESLVSKSLIKSDTDKIEPRFWMLETIHEYGRKLFSNDENKERIQNGHAGYFLGFAESLAPGLTGRRQRNCVTELLADAENLRTAIDWSIETGDINTTARMFHALLWLWIPRGQLTECRKWIQKAMERFHDLEDCRDKALIHETAAWTDAMAGDYLAAVPSLEICREIYKEHGNEADIARVNLLLGVAMAEMQKEGGNELCTSGMETFRELNDKYYLAMGKISVGITHLYVGEVMETIKCMEEALEVFYDIGNTYWPGQLLQNLAHFRLQSGDPEGAIEALLESMDIARRFDYPIVSSLSLAGLGAVATVQDRPIEAARLFGYVLTSLDKLGVSFEPLDQAEMDKYYALSKDALTEAEFQEALTDGASWNEQEVRAAALAMGQI